jgi:hypothetical protein
MFVYLQPIGPKGNENGAQKSPTLWGQTGNFCYSQVHIHRIEQNKRYEHGGDCICDGSNSLFKMDILFAGEAFYLDRLLFKPVFDIAVETDIPLNSFSIRKCGVKFGELNHRQRSQLEYFICNHTLDAADFKPAFQPWNDARMMLRKPNEMVESIV